MMLRPKAAPIIEPRSLPIHYELKATLAERMVYHWGDQAQLGGQSFRAMEPDEKIIDPSLLPHGWTEERQKWGEAAKVKMTSFVHRGGVSWTSKDMSSVLSSLVVTTSRASSMLVCVL